MPLAQGVFKQTRIARQSAKGTLAAAGGGFIVRREQSTFELAKETYTTESEITSTQQLLSNAHGVRLVNGKLSGILSPGTYSDAIATVMRRDFATVVSITGASITITGAGPHTITRAAGSFLTDNIKVGMVVRLTAGGFNAANSNKNLLVSAVAALTLTVSVVNAAVVGALVAEGPVTAATLSVPGKTTFIPATSHTNIYFTVEEFYPDVPFSERNLDVKFLMANLKLPGTGNAKVDLSGNGLNQTNNTTAYFTAPAAETTTGSLVAASGLLLIGGVSQAIVTDLSIDIDGKGQPADGVVGTDIRPDIFTGKCMVKGSFTAYFDSATIPTLFLNQVSTTLLCVVTAGSAASSDFMGFAMTDVRINTSTPDDTETGLKRTYSFVAVLNGAGGVGLAAERTSLQLQDSQAL